MNVTKEMEIGGKTLKVVLGRTARQADGAAWVQLGDTVLHATVVSQKEPREGMDFLPLTVDYREKMYAAGKIPGGFFKREGKPNENEVLNARIIDRPIRPLFPDGYRCETQVMVAVLSADMENCASVLGAIAASLALNLSDIPMSEAVASVRVGLIEGNFVVNPTFEEQEVSDLDLIIAGSADAIAMVEGHGNEISNQTLIEALAFGHDHIKKIVAFQQELIDEYGVTKREFIPVEKDEELAREVENKGMEQIIAISTETDKSKRKEMTKALVDSLIEGLDPEDEDRISKVPEYVKDLLKNQVRKNIIEKNIRLDGRTSVDIRAIDIELGVLPRAHGSALFTRGQTQSLGVVTLGTKIDEQRLDQMDVEGFRRYMLHYNFPPYATGEVKNFFTVSRREIGHGKLGERALQPMIPSWNDFPYTLRIVSEIMESNGSSSMATVCSGSLALMDAGVPIKKPVAGIAMGLIIEDDQYRILTDILGDEDHLGDMDFKVAGTRDGITAFQMDIKIKGISQEIMAAALEQAYAARLNILDTMDKAISAPRSEVSNYAPRFITVKIPVDRIGALIGPGGKVIREIIADTGATIDVEDDGSVRIGSSNNESAQAALKRVEELTQVPEEGKIYQGEIKKIMDFGAFVEILPGVEGLLHISQIDNRRVNNVSDYFKVGDKVEVKLLRIEPNGKFDLSRKVLLQPDPYQQPSGNQDQGPQGNFMNKKFNRGKPSRDRDRDRKNRR